MLNKQTASSDKELPWNVTVSREFLFQKQSQQPLPVTLRMAKYGRAVFPPDLCPSGINWVIKKPSSKTAFLWWSWRGSNPRPIDCEPIALPTELQPHFLFRHGERFPIALRTYASPRLLSLPLLRQGYQDVADKNDLSFLLSRPNWATAPNEIL